MSNLPFSPACERNKVPIGDALEDVLPVGGDVLEIGSGTGQHVVYLASRFARLRWQPSDRADCLPGLVARVEQEAGENVLPPVELDVCGEWPARRFDAAYSANTAHIMGWDAVCSMFAGVGACLKTGGVFCLYGPFNEQGQYTSASNAEFDRDLRLRDPAMGIRDRESLESLAEDQGMSLRNVFKLPANNQLLVFYRKGD